MLIADEYKQLRFLSEFIRKNIVNKKEIDYFLKNNIMSKTEKGYEFVDEFADLNTHLIKKSDNGGLNEVFEIIKQKQGIKAKLISELLKRPIDTIDKQIKKLVDKELIERRGSKKTGGYYIKTEEIKNA